MNDDTRFSEKAFFEFIEFVHKKGLVKSSKAANWKSSVTQLLSIMEENEKSDLRGIDIDLLISRFANLKGTTMTGSTLKIYRSRFKGAYTDFISWAEDPVNFTPSGRTYSGKQIDSEKGNNPSVSVTPQEEKPSGRRSRIISPLDSNTGQVNTNKLNDSVVFPIPISGGRVITINNLPYELTRADADRIAAVIKALAIADS